MASDLGELMAVGKQCQVAAKNINRDGRCHEKRTYPEAPVTMHPPPVRAGVGLAAIAAVSFMVMLASGHLVS